MDLWKPEGRLRVSEKCRCCAREEHATATGCAMADGDERQRMCVYGLAKLLKCREAVQERPILELFR